MDFFSTVIGVYAAIAAVWFLILIVSLIVIYRRKDMHKAEKLFWTVVIVMAPILGLICFFIWGKKKRPHSVDLAERYKR